LSLRSLWFSIVRKKRSNLALLPTVKHNSHVCLSGPIDMRWMCQHFSEYAVVTPLAATSSAGDGYTQASTADMDEIDIEYILRQQSRGRGQGI